MIVTMKTDNVISIANLIEKIHATKRLEYFFFKKKKNTHNPLNKENMKGRRG